MSFQELPTELQCSIIRLLEPISLISISQTNTYFRHLVSPKKKHFAERLIALEQVEEHGGPSPFFRPRDNYLNPDWSDKEWSDIRWACAECLRLLSHKHFDNHSILKLPYRKPIPGSPAAGFLTTWEPMGYTPRKCSKDPRRLREASDALWDEQIQRKRYLIAVTPGRGRIARLGNPQGATYQFDRVQTLPGFSGLSHDQFESMLSAEKLKVFDDNALAFERERGGRKRWLRKCIECRYLRGEFKPKLNRYRGTEKMPIVPSRQILFGSHVDRFFPGFSEYMDHKRPLFNAPLFRIYRDNARDLLWTMWMARCPGCARWQEIREFRFPASYQHWKPVVHPHAEEPSETWDDKLITQSLLDESRCNKCFAEAKGRDELGQVLSSWAMNLIDSQLMMLSWQLQSGWGYLKSSLLDNLPKAYKPELKNLVKTTPCLQKDIYYVVNYDDVALLRHRRGEWKDMWERMKQSGDTKWASRDMDEWFEQWGREFDDSEAHWRWMKAARREVEEKPEALVEWALNRDGASFL
ncbi:Signal recognition particle SRP54 subunit GTPase [Fusarium albosuccineum]|uniref:Signal recognition particle SRP54 subunit GTPase n=1 Tax=Fusarium albosuccineum TaxID=1237068 RepID=A0A8H4PCD1_9HYPO|nr:Signal recognition particle SRP54 subunit GTPase [Fusarium albosuccineum]